ncbi:MAG TPA: SBBP repeat-containing protein [Syntrophales bacterium]|nr:SBBP repeat-containing protein [Syntrophales bacterium]
MKNVFTKIMIWLTAGAMGVLVVSSVLAASFSCEKASSLQEKLICNDSELSRLDDELSAIYKKVLADAPNKDQFKKLQRNWLTDVRNKCSNRECLNQAYKTRIGLLNKPSLSVGQYRSQIAFSTYLGGKGDDRANSIRVDSAGNIYIGGYTQYWDDFPTLNAIQDKRRGDRSGIVAKFSHDGDLQWATHLGGIKSYSSSSSVYNEVYGVAVDGAGGLYVAGDTTSMDFPTINATQPTAKSGLESFLAKFDKNGKLVWSTYIGSYGIYGIRSVTADNSGDVYLTGWQRFKCTIAKFDKSGKFVWIKEFGGADHWTEAKSIVVDVSGNIYIGGITQIGVLPKQIGGIQYAKGHWINPYIAKFDRNGELLWSTKLGGGDDDDISGIDTDNTGNVYITGITKSKYFPTLNANQPKRQGREDAFVAKFSSDGRLLWSTYLGGTGNDSAKAIAVDATGNIHVTGYTASIRFPLKNAFQERRAGLVNAFITTFSPEGQILRSSYLGGSGNENELDIGFSITADQNANVYVTGYAGSSDFPLKNPYQSVSGGNNDIFVTKIELLK